tara:strand:+ start:303 stop:710 length:408 start_codon:yes stop_codon:yes gene_type:complete
MAVVRFGVSVESEVLEILDQYIQANHFPNRSQAIRNLIQEIDVKQQWQANEIVGGSLTLIYDLHKREIADKLIAIQQDYMHLIMCSQRIHIDHNHSMEVIAMKGPAFTLQQLANKLIAVKGVIHGDLSMTKMKSK